MIKFFFQIKRKSSMAGSIFDNYMKTTVACSYLDSRTKIGAGQQFSQQLHHNCIYLNFCVHLA